VALTQGNTFHVAAEYQPMVRMIGLDADGVFDDPRIVSWRKLPDRENCTLDAELPEREEGTRKVRLHVKRYLKGHAGTLPADDEVKGFQALAGRDVPTAPLVGWGSLADGRSFTIFLDLAGYVPADKLIERGVPFDQLLAPTAALAARLHERGLHHRDLYLCHFMAAVRGGEGADAVDVKLIDTARVRELPGFLTRRRWVVKDLAQFWYSTTKLAVSDEQRSAWLASYAASRGLAGRSVEGLRRSIVRKTCWIARHDQRLNASQPQRNISISH
jgi:lipopolysaccharide kinase (Kdo/WaaP) family protein